MSGDAMTDSQTHPTFANAGKRVRSEPLSLRELCCLMTLASVTVAVVTHRTWNTDERWLLGLTLSGTLAAILIARTFRWRVCLAGVIAGTLGGITTICVIGRDWMVQLDELASRGLGIAEYRANYVAAAFASVAFAVLLAMIMVGVFRLLVWAIGTGDRSLVSLLRRRPLSSTIVIAGVGVAGLAAGNVDVIVAPRSWKATAFLQLERIERPAFARHGLFTVRTGSLSRDGNWLLVESYMPGIGREVAEKAIYRLDPQPHAVRFTDHPERACFVAFDCDGNRIAFLEWLGESYHDRPAETHQLRVVDLDHHTSETLPERPRNADVHSLQFLPAGSLVIHYGDSWNGKKGYTRLVRHEGEWSRVESSDNASFDARSAIGLEFGREFQMVDLDTSAPLVTFPASWMEEMGNVNQMHLSPNGRYILAGPRIYDVESHTTTNWAGEDTWASPLLFGFSNRNLVAYYDHSSTYLRGRMSFLCDVPLAKRILDWLLRKPLQLLEPANAREVARTRNLSSTPTDVVFSHDGSRMAVFTDEGVYIYHVPPPE
ncbi:MAG: hypothetical protein KDB14_07735 [Planctomycetales bacterium]|nr:hypothetical protein [Planctomycetales bacterium]